MNKLLIGLMLLTSTSSFSNVIWNSRETQFMLPSIDQEGGLSAAVKNVCKDKNNERYNTLNKIYKKIEQKYPSKNSQLKSFSNCLLSASVSRVLLNNQLHYGFPLDLNEESLNSVTQSLSRSKIMRFSKNVSKLFKKFKKGRKHLIFKVKDVMDTLFVSELTSTSVHHYIKSGRYTQSWAPSIDDINFVAKSLGSTAEARKAVSFKQLYIDTFIEFWKQSKLDKNKELYMDSYNVDSIEAVTIKTNRSNSKKIYKHVDETFYFGNMNIYINDEKIAYGYSENTANKNDNKLGKTSKWSFFSVGLNRIDETYPDIISNFRSLNWSPIGETRPELDTSYGIRVTVRTSGHDLVLLKHKGKEYVTFEGRPCDIDEESRDIFHCQLPIVSKEVTFTDMVKYMNDFELVNTVK